MPLNSLNPNAVNSGENAAAGIPAEGTQPTQKTLSTLNPNAVSWGGASASRVSVQRPQIARQHGAVPQADARRATTKAVSWGENAVREIPAREVKGAKSAARKAARAAKAASKKPVAALAPLSKEIVFVKDAAPSEQEAAQRPLSDVLKLLSDFRPFLKQPTFYRARFELDFNKSLTPAFSTFHRNFRQYVIDMGFILILNHPEQYSFIITQVTDLFKAYGDRYKESPLLKAMVDFFWAYDRLPSGLEKMKEASDTFYSQSDLMLAALTSPQTRESMIQEVTDTFVRYKGAILPALHSPVVFTAIVKDNPYLKRSLNKIECGLQAHLKGVEERDLYFQVMAGHLEEGGQEFLWPPFSEDNTASFKLLLWRNPGLLRSLHENLRSIESYGEAFEWSRPLHYFYERHVDTSLLHLFYDREKSKEFFDRCSFHEPLVFLLRDLCFDSLEACHRARQMDPWSKYLFMKCILSTVPEICFSLLPILKEDDFEHCAFVMAARPEGLQGETPVSEVQCEVEPAASPDQCKTGLAASPPTVMQPDHLFFKREDKSLFSGSSLTLGTGTGSAFHPVAKS